MFTKSSKMIIYLLQLSQFISYNQFELLKMFKEVECPQLCKFMTLSELPKHQDYQKRIFTSVEVISSDEQRDYQIIFFKMKSPDIGILIFVDNCLTFKKTLSIANYHVQQITTLKAIEKPNPQKATQYSNLRKDKICLILSIGYRDGQIQLYSVNLLNFSNNISFQIKMTGNLTTKAKQPITNIQLDWKRQNKQAIYASKTSCISAYTQYPKPTEVIVKPKKQKSILQPSCWNVLLYRPLVVSEGMLYAYNQNTGYFCYNLPKLNNEQSTNMIDSIVSLNIGLMVLSAEQKKGKSILIIGSTDDALKMYDFGQKKIFKYIGAKNNVISIITELDLIIAGCYDGTVYFFQGVTSSSQKRSSIKCEVEEVQLIYGKKISENGIKHMEKCGQLLIIADFENCISIFDIISPPETSQRLQTAGINSSFSQSK